LAGEVEVLVQFVLKRGVWRLPAEYLPAERAKKGILVLLELLVGKVRRTKVERLVDAAKEARTLLGSFKEVKERVPKIEVPELVRH
jgi:hypothetical protein